MRILYREGNFYRSAIIHSWQLKQIYSSVKIQSIYKSYERRYVTSSTLSEKIIQNRAAILIQRWSRGLKLRKRFSLHLVLKQYVELLRKYPSKVLYMDKKQYRYLTESTYVNKVKFEDQSNFIITFNNDNEAIIVHFKSNICINYLYYRCSFNSIMVKCC